MSGVASKNPYALLDDSPPATPAPATKAAASPAAPAPAATRGGNSSRGNNKTRGAPRGGATGNRAPREGQEATEGGEPRKRYDGPRGERAPRGERGARAPRGDRGRGGERGGNRPFDKHSQTGKTDTDKKVAQGWGGEDGKSELKDESLAAADATAEGADWAGATTAATGDEWAVPAGDDATAATGEKKSNGDRERRPRGDRDAHEPREAREPEEEDNNLTYEQYLAQKTENAAIPKLEGSREVQGADSEIWKDAIALEKGKDVGSYFVGGKGKAPKARGEKKEKVFIDIDAKFAPPTSSSRGRGDGARGRGGRGGDRGRGDRGRGAPRGGNGPRAAQVGPAVDDESAFPSLS